MRSILLVDSGWAHTFRLAGDLAAGGLRVFVLGGDTRKAWLLPRGVTALPGLIDPRDAPAMVATVGRALAQTGADWVLPTGEPVLFACWSQQPPWTAALLPDIPAEQRPLYRHKQKMLDHLAARGIAVPEGAWLQRGDEAEIAQAGERLGWPLVVKVPDGYGGHGVVVAERLADALAAVRSLWADDPAYRPTLQTWLPGNNLLVGGLFENGRALHLIAAQKVEQGRPTTGPSIRLRTLDDPRLFDAARRCFETLGFTGIACLDFVSDANGCPLLIDVNPRPWGSIGVARAAGADLIGAWARRLQKQPAELSAQAPAEVDWVKLPDYLWPEAVAGSEFFSRLADPVVWRTWSRHRVADFLLEAKLAQYLVRIRLCPPRPGSQPGNEVQHPIRP